MGVTKHRNSGYEIGHAILRESLLSLCVIQKKLLDTSNVTKIKSIISFNSSTPYNAFGSDRSTLFKRSYANIYILCIYRYL